MAAKQVVDLMAILEKSVQDAKATRGEPATVHPMPAKKEAMAKKGAAMSGSSAAVAKKPVAKKAAAKRKPPRSA